MKMRGNKVRLADLARQLALVLERPVLDRTGFTGEFDLDLMFTADDALKGLPDSGARLGDPGPNIFAALQEQLGLKLSPATGPVEVLVIDHAERPAEN